MGMFPVLQYLFEVSQKCITSALLLVQIQPNFYFSNQPSFF
jgi:hypothetical protein